jgi:hypothetical protein
MLQVFRGSVHVRGDLRDVQRNKCRICCHQWQMNVAHGPVLEILAADKVGVSIAKYAEKRAGAS